MSFIRASVRVGHSLYRVQFNRRRCSNFASSSGTRSGSQMKYLVFVKQGLEDKTLGDCPFSHRVLLTLEEEGIVYDREFIDLDNKPEWFKDVNPAGSVPLMKLVDDENKTENWICGSGEICDYFAARENARVTYNNDNESVITAEAQEIVSRLFPAFVKYLKADKRNNSDAEEREKLVSVLLDLESLLQKVKDNCAETTTSNNVDGGLSLFLTSGSSVRPVDLDVLPKLHHLLVASAFFKADGSDENAETSSLPPLQDPQLIGRLPLLMNYIASMRARDSWKRTLYPDEFVIEGWKKHVAYK